MTLTAYMVRNAFGDYSRSDMREEFENAALRYEAQRQAAGSIFAEIGANALMDRYMSGKATAADVKALASDGKISKEEAIGYYMGKGWKLPKYGMR